MPYSPPVAAFTNPIPRLKQGLVASRPQGNQNHGLSDELGDAPAVSRHRVLRRGDRASHDDQVGTDLPGAGGRGDAHLVRHVAICKTHAGRDRQKLLAARPVHAASAT